MIRFTLNNEDISTDQPAGMTVLDFVRYHKDLKGTKIGCREGDCGACTILIGELVADQVKYRSMTSCLMPLANAAGKHIVTVEGINPTDGSLTPVQQAMVDESGTQCGFCTVGFVMSLTGFCIDDTAKTPEMAVSAVDGNICRCTGYKSIERAACKISKQVGEDSKQFVPEYFENIAQRLMNLNGSAQKANTREVASVPAGIPPFVGGGTDVYVQRPEDMADHPAAPLFYEEQLRGIRDTGDTIEIGASATVTDLLVSPIMQSIFPNLFKHLKLVSSTPIRNMATLAGNFVNASPIGDMTVCFLALNAEIDLCTSPHVSKGDTRTVLLKDFYLGYKQLAKKPDEIITAIRFKKPSGDFRFNFEKVSKRTYLDISTANTAISLHMDGRTIRDAHVSAGGVAPIPLYLRQTSEFLRGREVNEKTIATGNEIMQSEISPISDVRGTESYKRLLLRQLFQAHFVELFATENTEFTEKTK